MSMVCYIAPTANTPPVFGTVFLFSQQSVRPYVAITTTQMVDIQVMYQVDSYQQSIRPFKAVDKVDSSSGHLPSR